MTPPGGQLTAAHAANYHLAMVSDRIAALAFLAVGLYFFAGGLVQAAGLIGLGYMLFGLLEYVVRRWILHGPLPFTARDHARHHAQPTALIATPAFVVIIAALALWGLVSWVSTGGTAALGVFGMYAGYNYFALLHHWSHHHRHGVTGRAYWCRLDRQHHAHHRRYGVNFGVSTTFWDRLLGTFHPTD